jgi:hypothetical protein
MLIEEARRLGYPVRYWWLSDAVELEDAPDRLIVCVHHPATDENAGMDLYEALNRRGVEWDDLEHASLEEYLLYSKTINGTSGISRPDDSHSSPGNRDSKRPNRIAQSKTTCLCSPS